MEKRIWDWGEKRSEDEMAFCATEQFLYSEERQKNRNWNHVERQWKLLRDVEKYNVEWGIKSKHSELKIFVCWVLKWK